MTEHIETTPQITSPRLAYRVEEAGAVIGLGKSKMWELIAQGRLRAKRIDGATVIRHVDLVSFLDQTPDVQKIPADQPSI